MDKSTFDQSFARDVMAGLGANNKFIPSKYLYDEKGSRIFQSIMNLPEYYLTRAEFDILKEYKEGILGPIMATGRKFNLVELGAGDGLKTKILIKYLWENRIEFEYYPVDISGSSLTGLKESLAEEFEGVIVNPLEGTYGLSLRERKWENGLPTLMLFLGSNMGNFLEGEAMSLLQEVSGALNSHDMLLAGFDLKKDPELILRAYNDSVGVTRDFNMNLLTRINRELGGDFDLSKYKHWPLYDPVRGECKSYLISTEKQRVHLSALNEFVTIDAHEPIYTEVSKKYSLKELGNYAVANGFEMVHNFQDSKGYFTDSLWIKE